MTILFLRRNIWIYFGFQYRRFTPNLLYWSYILWVISTFFPVYFFSHVFAAYKKGEKWLQFLKLKLPNFIFILSNILSKRSFKMLQEHFFWLPTLKSCNFEMPWLKWNFTNSFERSNTYLFGARSSRTWQDF